MWRYSDQLSLIRTGGYAEIFIPGVLPDTTVFYLGWGPAQGDPNLGYIFFGKIMKLAQQETPTK